MEIVPDLSVPFILGQSFFTLHEEFSFKQERILPPLRISSEDTCFIAAANVKSPMIFSSLENCKPIATSSCRYNEDDQTFIDAEISRLLEQGIIKPSRSPWQAQVLVAKSRVGKRRMVVDYSKAINRYTPLDAYPLPIIDERVNNIAKGTVFSTLDLRSAYNQMPLHPDDRQFTGFEASGKFCRLPFGLTNGVSAFQRIMEKLLENFKLQGTYTFIWYLIIKIKMTMTKICKPCWMQQRSGALRSILRSLSWARVKSAYWDTDLNPAVLPPIQKDSSPCDRSQH